MDFKRKARESLQGLLGVHEGDDGLRHSLLTFVGDVANWDVANHSRWIKVVRELVKAAYPDETPLVVDPFAGGGSIPLEALRLGCETFASDLNPVACLIQKVMLEVIPRDGSNLAEELRRIGAEIKAAATNELSQFYPPDADGAKPIAYVWARVVRCESPNCGAEIPLVRSFWLCKNDRRKRAIRYKIVRPKGQPPRAQFEIFEPRTDDDVPKGTVNRAKATCVCCNITLPADRVRAQLSAQRGGADVIFDSRGQRIGGAILQAVVTLAQDESGRAYRLPTLRDYEAVRSAINRCDKLASEPLPNGMNPVPDEPTPPGGGSGAGRAFSVQKYGMMRFGDLFTARQRLALNVLSNAVGTCAERTTKESHLCMALVVGRCADYNSSLCRWVASGEFIGNTYTRQVLPIVWDFCETNVLSESTGGLSSALNWVSNVICTLPPMQQGQSQVADATQSPLPDESAAIWFTDPPYYDAIPYSDLSDFFFVWLKRSLRDCSFLHDPFDLKNSLTPKTREIVQDETKHFDGRVKDRQFFEEAMGRAFAEGCRVLNHDGVGCVVFAHKTTEGWEALLTGLIAGGWVITGSWPIATEMGARLRARESAALATSVHLVCRPRSDKSSVGDWGDVLRELPPRVADWIERLQGEGVRGADLVFACIGPALEIFSRYSTVESAEGREVTLAEYLEKVWEVVGRTALEQVLGTAEAAARNGAAGAVEEDARLTALFLWTLQSTNIESAIDGADADQDVEESDDDDDGSPKPTRGYTLIYDVVRRFAQPLGIHLEDWENRIIENKKGVVRLLSVAERAKQLFGEDGASAVADRIETDARAARSAQMLLFPEAEAPPKVRGRATRAATGGPVSDESLRTRREATTLDRVHAAMLLQASGRANALRALLKAEMDRGPDFLRLSNALTRLYPRESEEKRLLDAMLLALPR